MTNNTTSSCHNCMVLIRKLVLHSMIHNVRVFARYVTSKNKIFVDLSSRNKIQPFLDLGQGHFDDKPSSIPTDLWPVEKIWSILFAGQKTIQRTSLSSTSWICCKDMERILDNLRSKQNRESTAQNYYSIWKQFNKFMVKLDVWPRDWEHCVALYCTYLVNEGRQSNTINSYISTIKAILRADKYKWNDQLGQLNVITWACKYTNDAIRTRLPIMKGFLEVILFKLQRHYGDQNPQPFLESLYRSLFLLAYYGMMRVGELTMDSNNYTLKAKDLFIGRNKNKILIVLYSSKTHLPGQTPQQIKISANQQYDSNSLFCPFKSTREYLTMRGNYSSEEEPFFIFSDGSPVKPDNFRSIMRELIKKLNLNPLLYNTQSF